jgi:peroxiredoxin
MIKNIRIFALALTALAVFAGTAGTAGADAAREAEAKKAMDKMMEELQGGRNTMTMERLIVKAENDLKGFIETYGGTAASGSAMVVLGQIYSQSGRGADAKEILRKYLDSPLPKKSSDESLALMSIANTCLAEDKFDEAEATLRKAVAIEGIDPRMKKSAEDLIARLETMKKLKIGAEILDFNATDMAGKKISPSDYRGKVVLLDFWATWCAPCRAEMPNVKKIYATYHGKGFDIIGVSMDNNRQALESYLKEQDMKWRQIYDGKGWQAELGKVFAVSAIPTTLLIDKQGKIRHKNLRGKELGKAVEKLLAEK